MSSPALAVIVLAILGSGLNGGLFFVFSNAVMKALDRLPAPEGMAAMQSINTTIINPLFLCLFMGTALICALVVVIAVLEWSEPGALLLLLGALAYLGGTFLVTMAFNVPLNNVLAARAPGDPASAEVWSRYLRTWTRWTHVRAATCAIAFLFLTAGLIQTIATAAT